MQILQINKIKKASAFVSYIIDIVCFVCFAPLHVPIFCPVPPRARKFERAVNLAEVVLWADAE
jgi:hypothetical protein